MQGFSQLGIAFRWVQLQNGGDNLILIGTKRLNPAVRFHTGQRNLRDSICPIASTLASFELLYEFGTAFGRKDVSHSSVLSVWPDLHDDFADSFRVNVSEILVKAHRHILDECTPLRMALLAAR